MKKTGKANAPEAVDAAQLLPEMAGSEAKRLPAATGSARQRPSIVVISDGDAVTGVFAKASKGYQLHVAPSLIHGLSLVESLQPKMVFFQERMSGFSGEILARRVMAVAGRKCKRYLLSDGPLSPSVRDLVDGSVDTSLALAEQQQQLLALLPGKNKAKPQKAEPPVPEQAVVAALAIATTKPKRRDKKKAAAALADMGDREMSDIAVWRASEAVAAFGDQLSGEKQRQVEGGEVSFAKKKSTRRKASATQALQEPVLVEEPLLNEEQVPDPVAEQVTDSAQAAALAAGLRITGTSVGSAFSVIMRSRLAIGLSVAACLMVGATLHHLAAPSAPQERLAVATVAPVQQAKPQFGFLAHCAPDLPYAESHPGWARYVDRTLEYKVQSEQGVLRSVQLIDHGIEDHSQEFDAMKHELIGTRRLVPTGTSSENGYDVSKADIEGGGKVTGYRKAGSSRLRALVLDLPMTP